MFEVMLYAVLALVVVALGLTSFRLCREGPTRQAYLSTIRALRWWMLPAALGHLLVLLSTLSVLLTVSPWLQVGWWSLLGGTGNIALGQTGRPGAPWQVLAVLVPLWLASLVPHLAYQEEMAFRFGSDCDSLGRRLCRQVIFGLGHALFMGVPIGAGTALIFSGLLYERIYLSTFHRLARRTELVALPTLPAPEPYPSYPVGRYNAAAWDAHSAEFERVVASNKARLDSHFADARQARELRHTQEDELRTSAATTAAAFHAVSNWLVVALLLSWLTISAAS